MSESLPQTFPFAGWQIKYKLHEAKKADTSTDTGLSQQTVVFVHGTPWSSEVFVPLAEAISATLECSILLYDLVGYGESQALDASTSSHAADKNGFVGDTSVKAQGEALAALLAHLKLDGKTQGRPVPAVIAHDIAGTIALRAHLLHGCDFVSLLLLDTNCILPWGDGFYNQVRTNPKLFLDMTPSIFEAVVRAVIRSALCEPKKLSSGWEDVLAEPWLPSLTTTAESGSTSAADKDGQRNFVRQIAQANDADVAEMLDRGMYKDVRCSVKIMWGEQDGWIPGPKMEKLAEMLRHCLKSFVRIPQAGHLLMIDQPERVTAEVVSWLTRQT